MLTVDNVTIAVYHDLDKASDRMRLHLVVNSANAFHYSIDDHGVNYDMALARICAVAPIIAKVDAQLAEMYDGDLTQEPTKEDIQKCLEFKRWALNHDLRSHGDWFEYISE